MTKVFVLVVLTCASLQATALVYDFNGIVPTLSITAVRHPVGFTLVVPDFLDLSPGQILSLDCGEFVATVNCGFSYGGRVTFAAHAHDFGGGTFSDVLTFQDSFNVSTGWYFPSGAFDRTLGTFSTLDPSYTGPYTNIGTLTITKTPEPGSYCFALSALLVFGLRRTHVLLRFQC